METWALLLGALALGAGCGGKKAAETPTTPEGEVAATSAQKEPSSETTSDGEPVDGPLSAADSPADDAGGAAAPVPARKLEPRGPPPTRLVEAGNKALMAGKYEVAIQKARLALRRDEKYVPAMIILAKAYYHLGKYELASWIIEIALQVDPETPEAHNLRGFINLHKNDDARALASFKKATSTGSGYAVAWNNLGAQYLSAKNYGEAAQALEKAVKADSKLTKAHLNLGSAYRGLKEYRKAEAEYRLALKQEPNYAQAHFNMGILYLDAQEFPGLSTMTRLNSAISNFTKYKKLESFRLAKDDPVDAYIAEARKGIEREQKRIERERKKKAKQKKR